MVRLGPGDTPPPMECQSYVPPCVGQGARRAIRTRALEREGKGRKWHPCHVAAASQPRPHRAQALRTLLFAVGITQRGEAAFHRAHDARDVVLLLCGRETLYHLAQPLHLRRQLRPVLAVTRGAAYVYARGGGGNSIGGPRWGHNTMVAFHGRNF